jgi:hypothetical protein
MVFYDRTKTQVGVGDVSQKYCKSKKIKINQIYYRVIMRLRKLTINLQLMTAYFVFECCSYV